MSTQKSLFTGIGWFVVLFSSLLNSSPARAGNKLWINTGLKDRIVLSILISPVDHNIVFAGTDDGLYRSADGGENWSKIYQATNVYTIAAAPPSGWDEMVTFGADDGFFLSDLNGDPGTWKQCTSFSHGPVFAIMFRAPGAGLDDADLMLGTVNGVYGIYRNYCDAGENLGVFRVESIPQWHYVYRSDPVYDVVKTSETGFTQYYMIMADDGAHSRVWQNDASVISWYEPHNFPWNRGLWHQDAVTSQINGAASQIYCLLTVPSSSGDRKLVAGTSNGIQGHIKALANVPINKIVLEDPNQLAVIFAASGNPPPCYGNYVVAVTNPQGVWRSTNAGQNWENTSHGLPSLNVITLAVSSDKTLFAGTEKGIYKWIDAGGNNLVSPQTAVGHQLVSDIVSDGLGNAIILWRGEDRGLFVQRMSPTGVKLWPADGVKVCDVKNGPLLSQMVSDGKGGAIIAWEDFRNKTGYDIYAQHVDVTGNIKWGTDGKPICTRQEDDRDISMASDGMGGAIIVWDSGRRIRAQWLDAQGTEKWDANGFEVVNVASYQYKPEIMMAADGSAIMVWEDKRFLPDKPDRDIFAQRLDMNKNRLWGESGKQISQNTETHYNFNPHLVSDGAGGAIILWSESVQAGDKLRAQRLDASGNRIWGDNGKPLCTASGRQGGSNIVADGLGGAFITWLDQQTGYGYGNDIYLQQVANDGSFMCGEHGRLVCDAPGYRYPAVMVYDSLNYGVFLAWDDGRAGDSFSDVYMQWVGYNFNVPVNSKNFRPRMCSDFVLRQNYPNPFNPETEIRFEFPQACQVVLKIYNVLGEEIQTLVDKPCEAGYHIALWNGRDKNQAAVSSGIYFYRLDAQTANGKRFVDTKKMSLLR